MPKKYFVTRHRGAVSWAAQSGTKARKIEMENFDAAVLHAGDVVMGTLPVHIAAQVNARGAHYWHLTMDIPVEFRGQELTADQMRAFGARLEEFRVQGFGRRDSLQAEQALELAPAKVHLCIATGQTLPNFLPLLALPWERVVIFASADMKEQADRLQELVDALGVSRGKLAPCCERISMPKQMDWIALRTFAAKQAERFNLEQGVDFNLTGGNKLMTMAFSEAFRSQARQLYCSTQDETIAVIDTVSKDAVALPPDLVDLDMYLAAQGFKRAEQANAVSMPELQQRQSLTVSLVLGATELEQVYFRTHYQEVGISLQSMQDSDKYKPSNLLSLLHVLGADACEEKRGNSPHAFRPWVRVTIERSSPMPCGAFEALQDHGLISALAIEPASGVISFRFRDDDAARYLAGGYLEEYVLLCLHSLDLPPSHYASNVHIGVTHKRNKDVTNRLNELDAVAVWRNQLLVVECKAGLQLLNGKDQDIMNKLDQLKDNVGGAMGKAWLVSSRDVSKNPDILQRAKINGINVMNGRTAMLELSKHFSQLFKREVNADWRPEQLLLPFAKAFAPGRKAPRPDKSRVGKV
jgi:CRISPR-associated protein Csx16